MILTDGQGLQLAENAGRRRENNFTHLSPAGSFQEVKCAQDIDFCILHRMLNRTFVAYRSSQVKDYFHICHSSLDQPGIAYVTHYELQVGKRLQITAIPGREVIQDYYFMSLGD